MSIRIKLLFMILGFAILLIGGFGVYIILQQPIEQMNNEAKTLNELSSAIADVQLEANLLLSTDFPAQVEIYQKSLTFHDEVFAKIQNLSLIPKLNEKTAEAFRALLDLRDLYTQYLKKIQESATQNIDGYKEVQLINNMKSLSDMIGADSDEKIVNNSVFRYNFGQLKNALRDLNGSFVVTIKVLHDQLEAIDAALADYKTNQIVVSIIVLVVVFAAGIVLFLLMIQRMVGGILNVEEQISRMARGELDAKIESKRRDEIGELTRNLNHFSDEVSKAIHEIQLASRQNNEASRKLVDGVNDASSSTHEIETNTGLIGHQMSRINELTGSSVQAVEQMAGGIQSFNARIGQQNAMINDSSSAVTQMLASIDNITRITEQDSKAAEELVVEAEKGMVVIDDTFEKVSEISLSVDQIQDMVHIIEGIASQTNLLAMNAAIEAAHAGDSGKGFAVVADEIRKLAEMASLSSKEIAEKTRGIIETITQAAATRESSTATLAMIIKRIQGVSRSIGEIYSNVSEMKAGSNMILSAINDLRSDSKIITDDSSAIQKRMDEVRGGIETLGRISEETTSNIGEITAGLKMISNAMISISELAHSVGDIGEALTHSAHYFKLEAAPEPDDNPK